MFPGPYEKHLRILTYLYSMKPMNLIVRYNGLGCFILTQDKEVGRRRKYVYIPHICKASYKVLYKMLRYDYTHTVCVYICVMLIQLGRNINT